MSELNVAPVADNTWTVSAFDYRTLFVAGDDGVVAVNTFGTAELADAYLDTIRSTIPGTRISATVTTIDHLDHTGQKAIVGKGNDVIAHQLCATVMERRDRRRASQVARRLVGEGEQLEIGGVQLSLLYLGPTQGTGNVAVHLPDQRLLFMVGPRADARYGLMSDMHFRHMTRVWRELAQLDVDVVVPGRGPLMDRASLFRAADYIDALSAASQQAFADGVPIWVIDAMEPYVKGRLHDRFGDLDGFERHVGIGAMRLVHFFLMGGWGLEDTRTPEALLTAA